MTTVQCSLTLDTVFTQCQKKKKKIRVFFNIFPEELKNHLLDSLLLITLLLITLSKCRTVSVS